MVSVILLLVNELKIYISKRTKIDIFPIFFLNVDSSFIIMNRVIRHSEAIIDILTEGTVSQIFYLGPSSRFMGPQK